MSRPARVCIDLAALRHNYQVARHRHGGRALAVLKANAYGHGAVQCAQALQGLADGFAVAFTQEALVLRAAGITAPVLVLEGVFSADELRLAARERLWLVVHQSSQIDMIEQAPAECGRWTVWLKLDSGMHRAGFAPDEFLAAHARLKACPQVADVVLMTHFSHADEITHPATPRQIACMDQLAAACPGQHSLCNSAGVLAWPSARRDWARPGIMLYGVDPRAQPNDDPLQPVMQLLSEVFAQRWLACGESVGYGGAFVTQRPTRLGLVAIGYADGYPRAAGNGTPVAIDGQPGGLIGRVSMDMLAVDLTDLPQTGVGSSVELWGRQVGVSTVAARAGTIGYELLCNVKRVPFEYLG